MAETGWPKWMDNFDKWRSADGNGNGGAIREGAKNFFAGWRSGGTVAGQPAGAGGDIGYMMSQWAPPALARQNHGRSPAIPVEAASGCFSGRGPGSIHASVGAITE